MIVILCHADDAAALWLAASLARAGVNALEVVTVEQLVYSRRITFGLGDAGAFGSVELPRGTLTLNSIDGLLNRIRYLPLLHFERAQPADRMYAASELSAFLLAWIHAVAGPVVNPPLPFELGGSSFPRSMLLHLAATAGVPTGGWHMSESDRHEEAPLPVTHAAVVFQHRIFGALLPPHLQRACAGLASRLGTPLLQVDLNHSPEHGWRFVDATGMADFRIGGQALVRAIANVMAPREAA